MKKQGVVYMKLYKNITIILVVLIILAGALVAVKFLPGNEEPKEPEKTQSTEYFDILRVKIDDISKVDVTTSKDSYTVTKSGSEVHLSDSENLMISNQFLQSLLNSCSYIYAEKVASENKDDAEIYGFTNPKATLNITLKDGSNKTLLVGNDTIDASGSYIKMADEDKIYIKSAYGLSSLIPEYKSFVNKSALRITPDKHESLSLFSLSKPGSMDIELKATKVKTEKTEGVLWEMKKPAFAEVNTTVFTNDVLTPLESFTANGIAEVKVSDLSKYGLDNPYAVLSISADGVTQKFTFGKEENGHRYFMTDDYATVYTASASSLGFLDVAYIDLMSRLICIENIKNVSTVEIKSPDKNYILKISGDERFIDDKKIEKDAFSKVYQNIIGLRFDSIDFNKKSSGNAVVTFKYTKNDKSTRVVSFESISDRNYLATVDGKGNYIITKKAVSEALKSIEKAYKETK